MMRVVVVPLLLLLLAGPALAHGHGHSHGHGDGHGHSHGQDDAEPLAFNIRPDGQTTVARHKHDGLTCEFTYAANGGTNEQWAMAVARLDDVTAVCTVERPDKASYLYFQHFALTMGRPVVLAQSHVEGSSGAHKLHGSEWVVEGTRLVSRAGGFDGSLRRIDLHTSA